MNTPLITGSPKGWWEGCSGFEVLERRRWPPKASIWVVLEIRVPFRDP